MTNENFYFVTHARGDHARVKPILKILQARGFPLWLESMLAPGEMWEDHIREALRQARGLLVFLSAQGLESPSIREQLKTIQAGQHDYILPILLEPIPMPPELVHLSPVDISTDTPLEGAKKIIQAMEALPELAMNSPCFSEPQSEVLAQAIADSARTGSKYRQTLPTQTPDSIFIVHGHDLDLRDQVEAYLQSLKIEAIVLSELDGGNQSLFQKFLTFSEKVEFAVVLLTADDYGASRRQYDAPNVGERALQFRARQNVILELGFFYGYLGWENVFILYKPPSEVFPNFEVPSDLGGILFDEVTGDWQNKLWRRLAAAGFQHP